MADQAKSVTIKGEDINAKLSFVSTGKSYKTGPNIGKPYYLGTYDGVNFTVNEEIYEAWKAGNMYALTLTQTTRQIPDPEDESKELEAKGWQFNAYMTHTQRLATKKAEVEYNQVERKADLELKMLETKAMGTVTEFSKSELERLKQLAGA